jgi:hypothetical protein
LAIYFVHEAGLVVCITYGPRHALRALLKTDGFLRV